MVTVLAFGDQPELYGLPANPTVPRAVTFWKGALKTIGNVAMAAGIFGAAASLRSLWTQAQEKVSTKVT